MLSKACLNPQDLAARYGGEEFVALLSGTEEAQALKVAQRFSEMLERNCIEHKHSGVAPHITVSMGIATHDTGSSYSAKELIEEADRALYKAKESGRNCVILASSLSADKAAEAS